MDILKAMQQRKSSRAYLVKEVSRRDIEEILAFASLAPSAINLQPWEFIITYGEEKDRLVRQLTKARSERMVKCGPGTEKPLPEKISRRAAEAMAVMEPKISSMGLTFNQFIEEGSCSFYGAPVAIIVAIDKLFPVVRYLDVGLAVSYLLLAAQAKGLATCPIGLITAYNEDIAQLLNIPEEKEILLGISLGYADESSPANAFRTGRVNLQEIVTWFE
ncbi:MAG: nitroreductase [Desulfobacteraceae bacterium]|nr:MAG: nitroreductase [Desulfobacteraceae bacterium]